MSVTHVYYEEAALHLKRNEGAFFLQATAVTTGLGDPVFAGATALLALNTKLKADLATYTTKRAAATGPTSTATAVSDRKLARGDVETTLNDIRHELNKFVITQPAEKGASILLKAGFTARKRPSLNLPDFGINSGANSGTVKLRIKHPAPGKRVTVEFHASGDGGKTWPLTDSGSKLSCIFTGLTVGAPYVFRWRAKIKGVWSDWTVSQPYTVR